MARFRGEVGYGESVEYPIDSGIYVDLITEIVYQGDVIRNVKQSENTDKVNADIVLNNAISIVADKYAIENAYNIKYVRWSGVLWTVTTVEVQSPRLLLNLGKVYNGPTPILVVPVMPEFDPETGELTITNMDGVIYKNADTNVVIDEDGSPYLVPTGETINVTTVPAIGYYFSDEDTVEWAFTAD